MSTKSKKDRPKHHHGWGIAERHARMSADGRLALGLWVGEHVQEDSERLNDVALICQTLDQARIHDLARANRGRHGDAFRLAQVASHRSDIVVPTTTTEVRTRFGRDVAADDAINRQRDVDAPAAGKSPYADIETVETELHALLVHRAQDGPEPGQPVFPGVEGEHGQIGRSIGR